MGAINYLFKTFISWLNGDENKKTFHECFMASWARSWIFRSTFSEFIVTMTD